jgi:pimeloyl-ACP methyl ester carboxylesterase
LPYHGARGVELAWSEGGEGAPAILVHETATSRQIWGEMAAIVAREARVVTYDRRGWGESGAPEGYRRTTVEEQSEDLAALIEAVGGGVPAVLCGAGLGAVIALDLMLRRTELAAGAVLIEPPLLALEPAATETLSEDRRTLEEAGAGDAVDVVDLYLSGRLAALAPGTERLPGSATAAARARPASVFAELGAVTAWSMPLRRLSSAGRPSRVVVSRSTPPLVRQAGVALAARLADCELRELDGPNAPPHLSEPVGVAELVIELLKGPGTALS